MDIKRVSRIKKSVRNAGLDKQHFSKFNLISLKLTQ